MPIAKKYSLTEMMIVAASRQLKDGCTALVGTGMPLAAGALAKKTHAPNLVMIFEAGGIDPSLPRLPISVGESITYYRGLESGTMANIMSACARGMVDVGFLGGAQIDMYGNLNSTVIGDYYKPKSRFPGSGGANDVGSLCWNTIQIMRHEKRRFMERVDFITTPGYLTGPGAREAAGLPANTGPQCVITTLGIMGYDDETKRMRLDGIYPGVTIDKVVQETGFELIIEKDKVYEVEPPQEEDLRIFHEIIDPVGVIMGKQKDKK